MSGLPSIRVAPVDAPLRDAVVRLRVHPAQAHFVSPAAVSLARAERNVGSQPMAILIDGEPVGFYRIERDAWVIAERDFGPDALGLRSFFINVHRQGHGLGKSALPVVRTDLIVRYPGAERLVLSVNCRNAVALALYRGDGFEDARALYHGGRSGPEHVLLRQLANGHLLRHPL